VKGALGLILTAALALAACSGSSSTGITVFAAASLADAMAELETAWEQLSPQTPLTISTGSSAALRVQIEEGADADVFLAADTTNPEALVSGGVAQGSPRNFASNSLAIVVPAGNPAAIASPLDLARAGVRIVAAGEDVPINRYAEQVVASLDDVPEDELDFSAGYEANIVSREDNVGAVMAKIELGEGDAAIVYVTDARASDSVEMIEIPADVNVVADYAAVVISDAQTASGPRDFLDWLTQPVAQGVFARHGFAPPR
jgi:molybdate transport system substrate-binding protein